MEQVRFLMLQKEDSKERIQKDPKGKLKIRTELISLVLTKNRETPSSSPASAQGQLGVPQLGRVSQAWMQVKLAKKNAGSRPGSCQE